MPIERDQAANLLEALVSLVRVTRTIAHRDAAHSVTATPIALLKLVSETDPRLGDLAEQLRVKPSVASRAVAALEGEGYVSRVADPADARACRIHITDTGRDYLKTREEWALDMVARTLSDWSPEDAAMSVRVLQRLEHSVDEWIGHFHNAVADGSDPLTTPVGPPATEPEPRPPTAAEATPEATPDATPEPSSTTSTTTAPTETTEIRSADGDVPADDPNAPLTIAAITTRETTAV